MPVITAQLLLSRFGLFNYSSMIAPRSVSVFFSLPPALPFHFLPTDKLFSEAQKIKASQHSCLCLTAQHGMIHTASPPGLVIALSWRGSSWKTDPPDHTRTHIHRYRTHTRAHTSTHSCKHTHTPFIHPAHLWHPSPSPPALLLSLSSIRIITPCSLTR